MNTSSQFNIKAVDFHTSNYGYFFKVAYHSGTLDNQYKVVYIPISRYPSVLMMDFLVAQQSRELPSELISQLEAAIREDLNNGETLIAFETADREWDAEGEMMEEYSQADRTKDAQRMKVFRDVTLAKRHEIQPGFKMLGSKFAYRVDQGKLSLDFIDSAERDISRDLTVERDQKTAHRDITRKMSIGAHQEAVRVMKHDMEVLREAIYAIRDINSDMYIERGMATSERDISSTLYVNRERVTAGRHITRDLMLIVGGTAKRSIFHDLTLERLIDSVRRKDHQLILTKEDTQGRLKGREYPFVMLKEIVARRDQAQPAHIYRSRLLAQRDERRNMHLVDPHLKGHRDIMSNMHIGRGAAGYRDINSLLHIEKPLNPGEKITKRITAQIERSLIPALRDRIRPLLIEQSMQFSLREIRSGLHLHSGHQGQRGNRMFLYLPADIKGYRKNERGLYVPVEGAGGSAWRRTKKLYVESVQYRADRSYVKKGHVYDGEGSDANASKAPYPSYLGEESLGDKIVYPDFGILDEEIIAQLGNNREGVYEDIMTLGDTQGTNIGLLMEEEFWASVLRELPAYFLEDIIGYKHFLADLMDDVLVGERFFKGESWIELAVEYGVTLPELAFITPDYIFGVRDRIEAIMESELPLGVFDNPRAAMVEDEGVIVGEQEERTAHINEVEAPGSLIPRPADIQIGNPLGYFEVQPAHLEQELLGQEPERPAYLGEGLLAQEPERHGHIGEDLLAQEPERPAHLEEELIGKKAEGNSDLADELVGVIPERPSILQEGMQGWVDLRPGDRLDDSLLADLQDRLAVLTTGFIFGERPDERAGHIVDMYYLGTTGIRDGVIAEDNWLYFTRLVLNQAIVGEELFATEPAKASELLQDIIGYMEPSESFLPEELVGEKKEHFATVLGEILADKELAEAIIEDYLLAQEQLKNGFIPEGIFGKEELKKALMQEGTLAQGLIYDYNDQDLIYEGGDPEEWEGGFGVPEDYDPKDPFNPYYPWVDEKVSEVLNEDDWIRFGPGVWERNKPKGEFYSRSDVNGDGGYYRNDFSRTDYTFTIDFKVDEAAADGAGIVFKYKDSRNYIKFTMYGGDGGITGTRNMALHKVVNGTETSMGSPMNPFTWESGKWYKLWVSVLGNRIKVKVNGRLQYDLVD